MSKVDRVAEYNHRQTVENLEFDNWKTLGEFYNQITGEDTDISGPGKLTYNFETAYEEEIFATWKSNTMELMGSENMVNYSMRLLKAESDNAVEKEAEKYNLAHQPVIRHFAGLFDY